MRSLATYLVCLSAPLALTILSGCGGTQSTTSLSPSDQRGPVPMAISTSLPIVIHDSFNVDAVNEPPGLKGNCWSVASGSIPLTVAPGTSSSPFTLSWPNGTSGCSTSATIGYGLDLFYSVHLLSGCIVRHYRLELHLRRSTGCWYRLQRASGRERQRGV
jgi:hypothetical protein